MSNPKPSTPPANLPHVDSLPDPRTHTVQEQASRASEQAMAREIAEVRTHELNYLGMGE